MRWGNGGTTRVGTRCYVVSTRDGSLKPCIVTTIRRPSLISWGKSERGHFVYVDNYDGGFNGETGYHITDTHTWLYLATPSLDAEYQRQVEAEKQGILATE